MSLVFNLVEKDNKLKGVIDYNADLFEENTIQIIALRYSEILNEIVKNPLLGIDLINSELELENNTALDFDFNF